jgi:hypothetical protein
MYDYAQEQSALNNQFESIQRNTNTLLQRRCLKSLRKCLQAKRIESAQFEQALKDRQRFQHQLIMFKLLKVGAYWQKRELAEFKDLKLWAAFCKWKSEVKPTLEKPRSCAVSEVSITPRTNSSHDEKVPARQERNERRETRRD